MGIEKNNQDREKQEEEYEEVKEKHKPLNDEELAKEIEEVSKEYDEEIKKIQDKTKKTLEGSNKNAKDGFEKTIKTEEESDKKNNKIVDEALKANMPKSDSKEENGDSKKVKMTDDDYYKLAIETIRRLRTSGKIPNDFSENDYMSEFPIRLLKIKKEVAINKIKKENEKKTKMYEKLTKYEKEGVGTSAILEIFYAKKKLKKRTDEFEYLKILKDAIPFFGDTSPAVTVAANKTWEENIDEKLKKKFEKYKKKPENKNANFKEYFDKKKPYYDAIKDKIDKKLEKNFYKKSIEKLFGGKKVQLKEAEEEYRRISIDREKYGDTGCVNMLYSRSSEREREVIENRRKNYEDKVSGREKDKKAEISENKKKSGGGILGF